GGGASGVVGITAPAGSASLATFIYGTPPVITGFSPDSAGQGAVVTITGKGFTGMTTVTFGGTSAASFTIWNDSTITGTLGLGTTGTITLSGPSGTATAGGFVYLNAAMQPVSLSSFSPDSAGQGATVTIRGLHLSGVTSISFGGTPVQSFRIFSDSIIYATIGAGSTGSVLVSGTNGADSLAGFVYLAAAPPPSLTITSFSPSTGSSGTTVSIRGTGLSAVRSVKFGGTPASSYATISDSLILAIVGSGSTGYVSVADNSSTDSLPGFVYTYDSTRHKDSTGAFKLLSFIGAYSGNDPLLQWQAAYDGIVSYYAVEREISDNQFQVIATITPLADDSAVHSYSFDDVGHDPGTNHYRLRIQDTTATYTYSAIITVELPGKSSMLVVYPNPVIYGFTYVNIPDIGKRSQFEVLDMSGKVMKTQVVDPGVAQTRVDMAGLNPGLYKLIWTDGTRFNFQTLLVLPQW
ncbi:MAG TPA: IPT/TIG domain-containing protein, partial [Puia sp.]|nr:IPT/TIG domain-containing protein [Puia sp.]